MALDKKNIIFGLSGLAVGALAVYLIMKNTTWLGANGMRNATGLEPTEPVLQKGSKGKDVLDFQKNMNVFFNLNGAVPENGLFDKDTTKAVSSLFEGTHALLDPVNGKVSRNFVNDFNTLINREKNQ
jgi:hypothetical protein